MTNVAFWTVVQAVDQAEQDNVPLSDNIPCMLHHIFDADQEHLLQRTSNNNHNTTTTTNNNNHTTTTNTTTNNNNKIVTNLTCLMPDDSLGITNAARRMNYIFDDSAHKDLPLTTGRKCEGGNCGCDCSCIIFPNNFATKQETNLTIFPELTSLTFNDLSIVSFATILQFTRFIERVRRTIAYEYGLPLSTILPLQAYSRKYVAGTTQQGGGGGEGDFVTLHTDEATHSGYHYSCVLYLSTQGEDFEGGDFVFNDRAPTTTTDNESSHNDDNDDNDTKEYDNGIVNNDNKNNKPVFSLEEELRLLHAKDEYEDEDENDDLNNELSLAEEIRRSGHILTPFHPIRGSAVIFSSGWENMHEVETITSGIRYTIPCFFTTCPVPKEAYEQMKVGIPTTNEEIADDWLHLLLAHRREMPMESVGRVKELLMKWHYMCTPLEEK